MVIATAPHIAHLDARLTARGIDIDSSKLCAQYLVYDAERILDKFMVGDGPDDKKFEKVVTDILRLARKDGRRVRAFGEMVAILWGKGHSGATIRLEHLWHKLCHDEKLSLRLPAHRLHPVGRHLPERNLRRPFAGRGWVNETPRRSRSDGLVVKTLPSRSQRQILRNRRASLTKKVS